MLRVFTLFCVVAIGFCRVCDATTYQWYDGDSLFDTTTCTPGNTITMPSSTPSKTGYNFQGWVPYRQIEYLQSTGTQWIDTGAIRTSNTIAHVTFAMNSSSPGSYSQTVLGHNTSSSKRFWVTAGYWGKFALGMGRGYAGNTKSLDTAKHTAILNSTNATVYLDGVSYAASEGTLSRDVESNLTIKLFNGSNLGSPAKAKIYSVQIYEGGELVRDMVPVLDSNGVACMYDKVNSQYYYNAGTGDFVAGPELSVANLSCDVMATCAQEEIEYLQATGTQWIDTGVMRTGDTIAHVTFAMNSATAQNTAQGILNASSDTTARFYVSGNTQSKFVLGLGAGYYNAKSLDTKVHTVILNSKTLQVFFDGVSVSRSYGTYTNTVEPNTNIFLFNTKLLNSPASAKIYSVKIYEDETLVRDMVPVLDSNGVACMYDKVNNQYYYNAGTGDFVAGPRKQLPICYSVYSPIDYNCSAGYYLPMQTPGCVSCPLNHYCPGGIYSYSETETLGLNLCPNNLVAPENMSEVGACGRTLHLGSDYIYLRSQKKTTPSLNFDMDGDGIADFFGSMTLQNVSMHNNTNKKLKVKIGNQIYSVYDDRTTIN